MPDQLACEQSPNAEVDGRPDVEERLVQVRLLALQKSVFRHRLGVRPVIEFMQAEGNGDEQHRRRRDGRHHVFH